ncbi:MAG: S-methyl-5'-thioadenosine phosphorylase [Phototrophicaceae bacterium]
MSQNIAKIAVIGGSGLYNIPGFTDATEINLDTPFGAPSGTITVGTLANKRIAFLPRHGAGHIYTPSTVPYRANIHALKQLGVRFIIAISAAGSLKEAFAPGHIVIPSQLFDHTKLERGRTFFDTGLVAHAGVADPFTPELRALLVESVQAAGGIVHDGGLFITVEGPRFSTKGESHIFRAWGCDLIGMTTSPEAFLAAEAEMAYAVMAHITDYDVWHESEAAVTSDSVFETSRKNLEVAKRALAYALTNLDENAILPVHDNLRTAIATNRAHISPDLYDALEVIVGKSLNG